MASEPRERLAPPTLPNSLPAEVVAGLEAMGHDLFGAQVHTNSTRPAALRGSAYTQGQNVHLDGAIVNDDAALDGEADVMARKAQETGMHTYDGPVGIVPET